MTLVLLATLRHSIWMFVRHVGAIAFFPLGLLDMSVLPAPGSFDILLIVLTAHNREHWWYYAVMATAGSVLGAAVSFQLGRRGGEAVLERKLGPRKSEKVFSWFRRWGFWSLLAGAIAPPPMPASALVLSAGALDYPWRKFLLCWTLGRTLRFGLVAWITMQYGRHLFRWLRTYYRPAMWTMIVLAVAGGIVALWLYRRRPSAEGPQEHERAA